MDGRDEELLAERISAAEAFALLGDETRMDVLRVLWEASGPLSYAELRREVAHGGSGNFNYHLGKLVGHFVRKTEEGYDLRFVGEQVVRALLGGTITSDPSLPATEIDERCTYCGSPVEMSYTDESISVRCTDCGGVVGGDYPHGTYMQYGFPPAGLVGRTREEAVDAAHVLYDSKLTPMIKGVCPECAGRTSTSVERCEAHEPDESGLCPACETRYEVWGVYECEHCRYGRRSALWFAALNHPSVVSFYGEFGLEESIPFRKLTWDNARFVRDIDVTVEDTDPYRFRVTIPVDENRLVVVMDGSLDVTSVEDADASEPA